jgi:signal transduction histidine kinase
MQHAKVVGTKFQTVLHADDGSQLAVLVSVRPLPRNGSKNPILAVVVTDMTEARRTEERLRALSQRVISAQETERGRVALELHDRITQLLCAILTRSQVLADKLPSRETASRREAAKLNDMLGQTAEEVERISRDLRPSVLGESGLVPVLRHTSAEFARRSGLTVSVTCARLNRKLASDTELTLYRILQETLRNVQQHARASRVTVRFTRRADAVQLAIHDDGIGFDPARLAAKRGRKGGLGLLNMRERIAYVGGSLRVISARGRGTTIEAQIPFRNGAPASGGGTRPRSHSAIL